MTRQNHNFSPDGHAGGAAARPETIASITPLLDAEAGRLDKTSGAPVDGLAAIRRLGLLDDPRLIDNGWHPDPDGLSRTLREIGRGNLSLGRIYEGHVNALKLIALYGHDTQRREAARDAAEGHLFAVWVTDGTTPVTIDAAWTLSGAKRFCSGAPLATRALITATDGEATRMLCVKLRAGERAMDDATDTHGMRGCATASVTFEGMIADKEAMIGGPGDYLREPAFSTGAWRASAVALGGLDALVDCTMSQLRARGRASDPHQAARLGAMLIARETSSLWVARAARIAEDEAAAPGHARAYVNLARIAVESAILDAIRLAQRSLGLAAFVRPNPAERLARDLATYLRQPAPDEALTEAAGWFAAHNEETGFAGV